MSGKLENAVYVNQQLAFAQLLIAKAKAIESPQSIPEHQEIHAYIDGATKQLASALIGFVREQTDLPLKAIVFGNLNIEVALADLPPEAAAMPVVNAIRAQIQPAGELYQLACVTKDPGAMGDLFAQAALDSANQAETNLLATTSMGPLAMLQLWLKKIQQLVETYRNLEIEE